MISLKTKEWEIKNIETILFDKDGTFIDLHFFWGKMTELRVNAILEKYNADKNYFTDLCLELGYDTKTGKMLEDGITALFSRVKIIEIFSKNLKKYGINATEEDIEKIFDEVSTIFYKDMQKYTKPIEDAINFIKNLHKTGVKLGIVTSDSVESTLLTLKNFKWEYLFNSVIGRESSEFTKESGEPTKLALKELNANQKTTVMIGDAPMDYISAQNAGIDTTILVASGQINKTALKNTSKYTVSSLSEIQIIQ